MKRLSLFLGKGIDRGFLSFGQVVGGSPLWVFLKCRQMLKIITTLEYVLKYTNMSIFSKFEPVDFIASLTLVAGFILMALHIDTVVGGLVTLIVGYYFGHKRQRENK